MESSAAHAPRSVSRRELLKRAGGGLGAIALSYLLSRDAKAAAPAARDARSRPPHFAPRAKSVIWLFMEGGPSHLDLFDPKPALERLAGQPMPASFGRPVTAMGTASNTLMGTKRKWARHGQSGLWVSDWYPETAKHVDDLAVIHSMWADGLNHVGSVCQMNTGSILAGRPSLGAWATYGLGSANENLPAFVVLADDKEVVGGPKNWSAGFIPATYQGTLFRSEGTPILDLAPPSSVSALEDVGASLSAGADALSTSVTGAGLTRDFDLVMDLFAEMLRRPSFPGADLDRLKGQAQASIVQAKVSPERVAGRNFDRAIYPPGHPLRPGTFEESEQALAATLRDDLVAFHARQYGPDRMILVLAGDLDPQRVREAIERRLGDWPRNPAARPIVPPDLPLQAAPAIQEAHIPDKSQTTILWGHAGGLKRSDPDFYAAQILNLVLGGGGLTSRLSTAIRDEQGLAYSVYSYFDTNLYPGPFQVGLGTNPANARKAIAALEAEIRRVLRDGLTQREVDEAVAYLTGRFPLRLETSAGVAEILWAMEFYGLGADYMDRYAGYYRSVTLDQVNAAGRQHLHPDRATLSVAGPPP